MAAETKPSTPAAKRTHTARTKTFEDHFASLSKAFGALGDEDRDRALGALRALYPHRPGVTREA